MSNSTTPDEDIHSLFAQYTAKQSVPVEVQPSGTATTITSTVSLSVPAKVLTTLAANQPIDILTAQRPAYLDEIRPESQKSEAVADVPTVTDEKQVDTEAKPTTTAHARRKRRADTLSLAAKAANAHGVQEAKGESIRKLGAEAMAVLDYISEDFVQLTTDKSYPYHPTDGSKPMDEKGFKAHCRKHFGVIAFEVAVGDERRAPAGDVWILADTPNKRVVRDLVMLPNSKSAGQDALDDPEYFNTWHTHKKTMVDPAEGVTLNDPRIAIFLNHLRRQAGNAPDCDVTVTFFLEGMAWIYQHPEDKLGWATLMYSKEGASGKSSLFDLFSPIFGDGLVASCTGADLEEKFTELTDRKRLVFVHELPSSGPWKRDNYERTKNRITERKVTSRRMRTGSVQILNTTHYFFTTNNRDCLPLMMGDRRVLVFQNDLPTLTKQQRADWGAFYKGEGPALVAGLLKNWKHNADYSHYDDVPQTAGALELQLESRSPLESLLAELVAEGKGPFAKDIGRARDIAAHLGNAHATATRHMSLDPSAISRALRKVGAIQIGNPTNPGSRALCWRKQDYWVEVPPKAFNAYIETGTPPDDYPKTEGEGHE